jgi:hypothetical protein
MKNAVRACRKSVEIDGRMFCLAWTGRVMETLFRVATARIKNGQPKIVCAF